MIDKTLSLKETQTFAEGRIDFLEPLIAEFGNVFHLKILWINLLVVCDPDLMREILVKQTSRVHKEQRTNEVVRRITGASMLTTEGDTWKRKRQLAQPAFHASRIQSYVDVMADYTREMIAGWQSGGAYSIDDDFQALTMRIITKTMFDVDIAAEAQELGRNITAALHIAQEQLGAPFLLPEWVPTPNHRKQKQALDKVRNVIGRIIAERKASGRDEGDLLSMLIQARDENGDALDDRELLDECLTVFGAGHETTAATMMWATYLLTQHPEEAAKLKAEVDTVLGADPVTFEALGKMPYSEWFVKEALRLYPPAFGAGRVAVEDFELGSRQVKEGTVILLGFYQMHRSAEYYPNPKQFWPERWSEEQPQPDRYAYLPFGAGPRVCIGNMFAMMEAQVILATLMQHVELELLSENVEMVEQFTLKPKDALRMRVTKREEREAIG